jgi:signal transduction histidine kinase
MGLAGRLDVSEYHALNPVVRWFINLRWIAAAGVLAALTVARALTSLPLRYPTLFVLGGTLAVVNVGWYLYFHVLRRAKLSQEELAVFLLLQVVGDYVLLFLLIYFTGFLENPLAFFFVFHTLLTAFLFRDEIAYLFVGGLVAVFAATVAAEYAGLIPHHPLLPTIDPAAYVRQLPLRGAGLAATVVISAYLMTTIKHRIAEKGRRVEIELDRYKTLDRVKSNFLLQVTHELRGPLAAINGYHEMIARGITGASSPRTIETIGKATRRTDNLLTMIDEMIDYAYMTGDVGPKLESAWIRVEDLISDTLDACATLIETRSIRIDTHCPPDLGIEANRDLMRIILGNLVTNALKYSPEGSTVTITAGVDRSDLCLVVRDQGIGIAAEDLDRIFEEFFRTRRARELERDGTGLGLSILKKTVEGMGGRIGVTSEVDRGSAFYVYLPRENRVNGRGA